MNKSDIAGYIASKAQLFSDVSDRVWDTAETAFEEYESAGILCDALRGEGFEVETGIAGIETAFCGRYGSGAPVIGILGEFDALSGLSQHAGLSEKRAVVPDGNGHGCGHNMLGAGSLAAAVGVKHYLEQSGKSGTVIYFGCPGEEGGSGKAFMAREGAFDELDIALSWHPEYRNLVWTGSSLANYQVKYIFRGVSAHAAANPHHGRSALDAVELMNIGVQFLREHIIPEARVHYAITNTGGFSPNVVQANAEVLYLIRAPRNPHVEEIYARINKIAEGAALMTETELEIDFIKGCSNIVPSDTLCEVLFSNMQQMPRPVYTDEEMARIESFAETASSPAAQHRTELEALPLPDEQRDAIMRQLDGPYYDFIVPYAPSSHLLAGSTDVGDVSWICPTAQIMTACWAAGTPGHSWQIVAQGKGASAHKSLLYAGQVLAGAAIDCIENPAIVERAGQELRTRLGEGGYVCPIPKGIRPRKVSGN